MSPAKKEAYRRDREQKKLVARMGVDPNNDWQAHYEVLPGKEKVVNELKKLAAKADHVFLATDLDREGKPLPGTCASLLVVMTAASSAWYLTKLLKTLFKKHFHSRQNLTCIGLTRSKRGVS